MKARELLNKIASTGYSMATMQELFRMAEWNSEKADEVARIIDETNSEEEILIRIEEVLKARGKNYFCNEPIIGVYLGQPEDEFGGELFLDCYREDITLYLTKGFRYLLETEHYGISVEYGGVFLLNKTGRVEDLENQGEWFSNYYTNPDPNDPEDCPWIDHEHTLFVGERLLHFEKSQNGYILTFDDFSVNLVQVDGDSTDCYRQKLWNHENHRMYGFERHLNQKCTNCGGKGVAYLDHVGDYFVKCESCSNGIRWDQMNMQDAIDEWNYVNTNYIYDSLREDPRPKEQAAEWFSSKWGVPKQEYLSCMEAYIKNKTEYGWYLCFDGAKIIGGLGVIENDFHSRKDLSPNICAVYVEPEYRGKGIAGKLLNMAVDDLKSKGITPVYLVTNHQGFYEKYGWEFLCTVNDENTLGQSRMYIHR